jgi:mono/diheme cytochrome c family protein
MRSNLFILLLALTGCSSPPPAAAAAQPADPLVRGHQIYVAKCAKCHKLYDPANYSDQEWKLWMQKMSRKAKLKPEQEKALTQYIDQKLRTQK